MNLKTKQRVKITYETSEDASNIPKFDSKNILNYKSNKYNIEIRKDDPPNKTTLALKKVETLLKNLI